MRRLHADARVGLIILGDDLEVGNLIADLDLLCVGFVEGELHAVLEVFAVTGVDARERRREADLHRQVVREAGQRCDCEDCAQYHNEGFQRLAKAHGLSFQRQVQIMNIGHGNRHLRPGTAVTLKQRAAR